MARGDASGAMDTRAIRWIRVRVVLLGLLFAPLLCALLYRAFVLQVVEGSKLARLAKDQHDRRVKLPGRRGSVLDRRGDALAASVDVDSIFADPSEVPEPAKAARSLAKALGVDGAKLEAALDPRRRFAWIKRQATPQEVVAVKALGLPGVGFLKEPRRFYPQRELAAHVLGFSGMDGEGLEGIELAFDLELQGKPQAISGVRDARGRSAIVDGTVPEEQLQGASVTLTIDRAVQYQAEKSLAAAVAKASAAAGMAVVLDPATGELLALANVPTFNPNDPGRYQKQALRNRAVTDQFEPGSTFKLFTVAGALAEGVIRPDDSFFCENGRYQIGRHAIHDHGGYKNLSIGEIIQVSSNIGVAKIAEKLGREKLQAYQKAFGFGERPGTGLPGEAKGSLPFPKANIALATHSFGQGLTASAVQIAAAYGALANGGVLMRPYLVQRVVDPDGSVLVQREPEKIRQAVPAKVAAQALAMMKLVVEKGGTAPLAAMADYEVAGKTGTAQKADPVTGGYSVDKRTASFVGVVPADAPRLVILVVIDEPKGDVYGGVVAAPAFKEIAQAALAHLGVPPSPAKAKALAAAKPAEEPLALDPQAKAKLLGAFAALDASPRAELPSEGFIEGGEPEFSPDESAVVPDVEGMTARAAVKALSAAELEPALAGVGKVVGQTPSAGATVRKGARVAVRLESSL